MGPPRVRSPEVPDGDGRHRLLHGVLRAGGGACRLQVHHAGRHRHRDPLRAGRGRARRGGCAGAALARPPGAGLPAPAAAAGHLLGRARVRAVAGDQGPHPGGQGDHQEGGQGEQEGGAAPPARPGRHERDRPGHQASPEQG